MDSTQASDKSVNGGDTGSQMAKGRNGDAREKLMDDMKNVINEAERWLGSASSRSGEEMRAVKEKFESTLDTAKTDLIKLQANMTARSKVAAQTADTYVKDNPWTSVGLGAAIGVALGLLIGRK
jgi:ElaB/YqjD/DUF883 family membrane-anchored ribosome-binding protein